MRQPKGLNSARTFQAQNSYWLFFINLSKIYQYSFHTVSVYRFPPENVELQMPRIKRIQLHSTLLNPTLLDDVPQCRTRWPNECNMLDSTLGIKRSGYKIYPQSLENKRAPYLFAQKVARDRSTVKRCLAAIALLKCWKRRMIESLKEERLGTG